MDYVHSFIYVESSLYLWDEANLVTVDNFLRVLKFDLCGGTNSNGSKRLMCLNAWHIGCVLGEVCHCGDGI